MFVCAPRHRERERERDKKEPTVDLIQFVSQTQPKTINKLRIPSTSAKVQNSIRLHWPIACFRTSKQFFGLEVSGPPQKCVGDLSRVYGPTSKQADPGDDAGQQVHGSTGGANELRQA